MKRNYLLIIALKDWHHSLKTINFRNFLQEPLDLAILVGSSGAVPTNDYIALHLMQRGTTVININLDASSNQIVDTDFFIEMKGEDAFVELNKIAFGEA